MSKSKAVAQSPRFNVAQRTSLRRVGLIDSQIDELERILPGCRIMTTDAPRLQDVRDELQVAAAAIGDAKAKISRLAMVTSSGTALWEARVRVEMSSYSVIQNSEEIARTLGLLDQIGCVFHDALAKLPKEQRRTKSASMAPIELIHDALIRGWANAGTGKINIMLSSGEKSAFKQIVCTCYEAFTGKQNSNPERAIKGYVRWLKARERRQRNEIGIPAPLQRRGRQTF